MRGQLSRTSEFLASTTVMERHSIGTPSCCSPIRRPRRMRFSRCSRLWSDRGPVRGSKPTSLTCGGPSETSAIRCSGGRRFRDSIHGETDALLEQVASVDSKPDERLALEAGIRLLTPEQREVVHLHVFDGLTFREIAEASGASINTVAARYRYALAKLRVLLDGVRPDHAQQGS